MSTDACQRTPACTMHHLDDHDLLDAWASRHDEDAFAALMDRHLPRVQAVCRHYLHHAAEADDAVQTTFLILARRAPVLVGRSWRRRVGIAGWLGETGARVSANAARARARRRRHEARAGEGRAAQAMIAAPAGDPEALRQALARLPETYRRPLVRCFLEGASRPAIAAELRLSLAATHKRLARGLALLRQGLMGVALPGALLPAGASLSTRVRAQLPLPGGTWRILAWAQHPFVATTAAAAGVAAVAVLAWPGAGPRTSRGMPHPSVAVSPAALPTVAQDPLRQAARVAVGRATGALLRLQRPDGEFPGGIYPDIAITAAAVEALDLVADGPLASPAVIAARDHAVQALAASLRTHQGHAQVAESAFETYAQAITLAAFAPHAAQLPDGRSCAHAAAVILLTAQNGHGGWRYTLAPRDADASVTGHVLLALAAAQAAGCVDARTAIARGEAYLQQCATRTGAITYVPGADTAGSVYCTALAAAACSAAGHGDGALAVRARSLVATDPLPVTQQPLLTARFAAEALAGDPAEAWTWARRALPALLASQQRDGGWASTAPGPSAAWPTACALAVVAHVVQLPLPVSAAPAAATVVAVATPVPRAAAHDGP